MNSSEWDKFRKQQATEREPFDLDWQKMSPLVLRLEETFKMLGKALNDFLLQSNTPAQRFFRLRSEN